MSDDNNCQENLNASDLPKTSLARLLMEEPPASQRAHVLDNPSVAECVSNLSVARTPNEWNEATAHLVLALLLNQSGGSEDWFQRSKDVCDMIRRGPQKPGANRPPANLRARLDARLFEHFASRCRTPGEAARLLMKFDTRLAYDTALKRAGRASQRGGYTFPEVGQRWRRPD
ncbi:hypothetical protein [Falsiroseomonas sp. E2-1-a20]|uniref:hypothetical protein n=1 Tax=Falsiroseomonas sp. E2-1-a20 TaxID=3239300 RepID=UPI003F392064